MDERISEISKMYADPAAGFFRPSRYGMQDHFGVGWGAPGPQSRNGGVRADGDSLVPKGFPKLMSIRRFYVAKKLEY